MPKSISDWNLRDIWAYNIKIVDQNTLEFFGVSDSDLPLPRVHDEVLAVKYFEAAQLHVLYCRLPHGYPTSHAVVAALDVHTDHGSKHVTSLAVSADAAALQWASRK